MKKRETKIAKGRHGVLSLYTCASMHPAYKPHTFGPHAGCQASRSKE